MMIGPFVGNTGWYDYSYADPKFSLEKIAKRKYYGATWQDKVKIDWAIEDRKLSMIAAKQTIKDIEQVKQKKDYTHDTYRYTSQNLQYLHHIEYFDYFNAFIGTSDFESIYQSYNIKYSIMGHVHFRNSFKEQGVTYICPCLGYSREWRTADIENEIRHALYQFSVLILCRN
ncbi:phosphohydrolase [Staphylococcus gallinarum]|uniref:Phosphohydrolase n=1 Tax=Staphylococcus gallinarum TaxID=1293 RepID=A0A380FMV2_STAGA|nr:phosphohydrolase [Staphylococcus gallinarum]